MREHELPTAPEMFRRAAAHVNQAYASLGDAGDELRSDWQPVGSALSSTQGTTRREVFDLLTEVKGKLNEAANLLDDAAQ